MTNLSQRDSRWKNIKLGFSKVTTIGSHGCCITAIAMLAGLTPVEVNNRLKAVNGFLVDLVIWTKIEEAIPWLKFEWRGYSYDNKRVSDSIEKNGGCLVQCDFDNNLTTKERHWVLFTGNKKLNDPWNGKTEPTSKYSEYTGYAVINKIGEKPSGTFVDKKTFERLVSNSGAYDEFVKNGMNSANETLETIYKIKEDYNKCKADLRANKITQEYLEAADLMVEEYSVVKRVLKNEYNITDKALKSEKALFDALESLTRRKAVEDLGSKDLIKILWSRLVKSLDRNKEI